MTNSWETRKEQWGASRKPVFLKFHPSQLRGIKTTVEITEGGFCT
jgi:hypothetical protein